jgi:ATP-dependent DNA helicase Q1
MQVMGLTALGIAAGMLTSTTTKDEEKSIYRSLEKGEGELRILYVTPEKIAKSKRFVSKLEKCNHAGRLSLVAIDVGGFSLTIASHVQSLATLQWKVGAFFDLDP